MLDLEFFGKVGNGDKLVVEDEQTIRNYTDIQGILQYAGQEVTVDCHEYGDVKIKEDGDYGNSTAEAVSTFQGIFGLPKTGVVDFKTWYEISRVYVAVTKIASLNPQI